MSTNNYNTIEYITIPPKSNTESVQTYLIADSTWRISPAFNIKQGDIIRWNHEQEYGVVPLNQEGKIDSRYLPSYVDDVIEGYLNENDNKFYELNTFDNEIKGESSKIYVDLATNKSYRYAANTYIIISGGVDENLATLSDVDSKISEALINPTNDLATKTYVGTLISSALIDPVNDLATKTYVGSQINSATANLATKDEVLNITIRQVNSGTITVSQNDNYAFNLTITIPSVLGYTPVSIAGYDFSDGEASLGKVCINNGNIEIKGTILLNGSSSFTIDFNVLYIVTTSLIPQANNINY